MLEDFNCYDRNGNAAPQGGVKLTLPTEESAFGSMQDLIRMGLEEDALLQGKQDAAVPEIVKQIKNTLPTFEAEQRVQKSERVQFSIREEAKEEVKKILAGEEIRHNIYLTDGTPAIMLGHAGVRNLPLSMKPSHIRENILTEEEAKQRGFPTGPDHHYHGLGEPLFYEVIDNLNDIVEGYRGTKYAAKPARRENYFLLVSKYKDADQNIINIPVYINTKALSNEMVMVDTNSLATVFGKIGFRDYIRREVQNKNLVRIKKKGTTTSERPAPIADDYSGIASESRVPQNAPSVNTQKSDRAVYSQQEQQDHIRAAASHFGTTHNWIEAGYLTTDGQVLDFSGRHDGAPGGSRTVDHRDISEALGLDYGGNGYSDAMIQFMSEGNIRLMPETGGINLQAEPTDRQYAELRRYITWALRHDGVVLDFDDQNGNTIRSEWYDPSSSISKNVSRSGEIIETIKTHYKNGGRQMSDLARFHSQYSLRSPANISSRELLANALETTAQNAAERDILQRYQARVAELNEIQQKLAEQRKRQTPYRTNVRYGAIVLYRISSRPSAIRISSSASCRKRRNRISSNNRSPESRSPRCSASSSRSRAGSPGRGGEEDGTGGASGTGGGGGGGASKGGGGGGRCGGGSSRCTTRS